MKMKKITAFIVAILSLLTIASFAPIANVRADETDVKFVHGYDSYKLEHIADQFDITLGEGEAVKAYKVNAEEKVNTGSYTFMSVGKNQTIEFFKNAEGTETLGSFTFEVVAKDEAKGSIKYSVDADNYAAYMEKVVKEVEAKKLNDNVTYPAITDLLTSELYPVDALKLTLYTCGPNSQTFSSSTGKTIKLSELGSYSFYVLAQDPSKNDLEIDSEKHVRKTVSGIEGWYDESDKLVAPIFTFNCAKAGQPEITAVDANKVLQGYVGLTYKNIKDYITITANGEKVEYKLYYSTLDKNLYTEYKLGLSGATDAWTSAGFKLVTDAAESGKLIDVTDSKKYSAIGFSTSSLSFTPDQKGCYYLLVSVKDAYGSHDLALAPIVVEAEVEEVKFEKQFLKNNWVSIMFLGIAVLCLIGIILLIFVKPKEVNEEEIVTEVVKK